MAVLKTVILASLALSVAACHTMRFELTDAPHAEVIRERKSFWVFGWAPTKTINLGERCPGGVASVKEETTFGDGFFSLITLGIWTPRTSWYYCLADDEP